MARSQKHRNKTFEDLFRLGKDYLQGLSKEEGDYQDLLDKVRSLAIHCNIPIGNRNQGDIYFLLKKILDETPRDIESKWSSEELKSAWIGRKGTYILFTKAPPAIVSKRKRPDSSSSSSSSSSKKKIKKKDFTKDLQFEKIKMQFQEETENPVSAIRSASQQMMEEFSDADEEPEPDLSYVELQALNQKNYAERTRFLKKASKYKHERDEERAIIVELNSQLNKLKDAKEAPVLTENQRKSLQRVKDYLEFKCLNINRQKAILRETIFSLLSIELSSDEE